MIVYEQQRNEDDRSLGELYFFFTDELADIIFGESFGIIMTAMMDNIRAIFWPTEGQLSFCQMSTARDIQGVIESKI